MVDAVHRILADSALNFNFRPEQLDVIETVLLRHLQQGCEPIARSRVKSSAEGVVRCGSPSADHNGAFHIYISAYCPRGGPAGVGGWSAVFESGAAVSGGLLRGADSITLNIVAVIAATRYRGKLALKDRALAIGRRSTMRKARIALARRLAIIMHAMLRHGTEFRAA
jgi:hypothetical protein